MVSIQRVTSHWIWVSDSPMVLLLSNSYKFFITGIGFDTICHVWEPVFLLQAMTSDNCFSIYSLLETTSFKLSILAASKLMSDDIISQMICRKKAITRSGHLKGHKIIPVATQFLFHKWTNDYLSFRWKWFCILFLVKCLTLCHTNLTLISYCYLLFLHPVLTTGRDVNECKHQK